MNNEPEYHLFLDKDKEELDSNVYKEIFNRSVSLEMTLNLSGKKNQVNVEKLLYSFYRLNLIYKKLIKKINTKLTSFPPVEFGYFRNNPFAKMYFITSISPKNEVRRYSSYMTDILLTNYEELKKIHGDDKSGF